MNTFIRFTLAALLSLVLVAPVAAQTSLSETTVSTAQTATQNNIVLASATGLADGVVIYVDREAMVVLTSWTSGTTAPVLRGALGTVATSHAAGVLAYIAPAVAVRSTPRAGSCAPTAERYLPQIDVSGGGVWHCSTTVLKWVNLRNQIPVNCRTVLTTDAIDQSCFIADRQYLLVKVLEIHTTAESGGTLTLVLRRQQGTEAPASGDALLASAIDMVGAGAVAQTLKTPALTATASLLLLEVGDRLGLDFTDDTAGELAGVTVTFFLIAM